MRGLKYSVDVNARIIKSFLDERRTDLLSIANLNVSDISEVKFMTSFSKRLSMEKPWFDFIAVADSSGNIVFSTKPIKKTLPRTYYEKLRTVDFYNSGISYSEILDTIAMIVSSPVYNRNHTAIGIILASVRLKTFYDLVLDLRIGETSEIFLVDAKGLFLSPSKLGGEVLTQYGHYKDEPNPHTKEGDVIKHRDYRGEKVICAYKRFDELNWYLVSEMDLEEALAPVIILKKIMFYIFLIVGCFLIFSSIFFSRRVTYLLKNLTSTLKTALDDISKKKNTIDTINVKLRERLRDCQSLTHQLEVSEEYIKNIINSISSGLIAIDKSFRITYCNAYVLNLAKKKEVKMLSELYETFPMFTKKEIRAHIDTIFNNRESFHIDRTSVTIDGQSATLSIWGFPIKDIDDVVGATLLVSDITGEEKLRAQMADYEKLSALSQLAMGAAHEINNPLLGITSFIELLIEEEDDVEKKTRAKEVLDSAYRISETIRGLLNFARPTPPKFNKVSINGLISETLSFLSHQPLFRKKKIEKVLSDAVPQITADVNQIRQVIINILINAAQAMPDGGVLTVQTNKVKFEDLVEIKVIDTGVGISEDNLKRVFDPFFTTKKGEGTGLGLSISYSYVKNHNGTITLKSEVNKGTEVTIVLPIRQKTIVQSEVVE